ncbi:MAG: hypothetical protein NTV70_01740 [Acidobacteria bacterium]|nr:hypothetical protein [Acidobacteriota bacterium]
MRYICTLCALAVSASASQVVDINLQNHFNDPGLPSGHGWTYFGNNGEGVYSHPGTWLQLYDIGSDAQAGYHFDKDLDRRDSWYLQTEFILYGSEGPWGFSFGLNNSQFTADFGITYGSIAVSGYGDYSYPWRGTIPHRLLAQGDKTGWDLQVNGQQIFNSRWYGGTGYMAPTDPTPRKYGSIYFGDTTGNQDAYWQIDYLFYHSQLDTPEPAWMGAAGLVLLAVGHFGRKR